MSEVGDSPLVTFALFTYNQEACVRQAVEAAFQQCYEPLQIILSDDSSSDATFAIMSEMASCYRGPHNVVVRKTPKNIGTLLHLKEVAGLATGGLLVLAAGDDISKRERTTVLVNHWRATGAWGLCSRFDRMDEAGHVLEESVESETIAGMTIAHMFYPEEGEIKFVHGCTSAYDARLFDYLNTLPNDYVLAEDGVLSILLNFLGKKIENLSESLIYYREWRSSLTNTGRASRSYKDVLDTEVRRAKLEGALSNSYALVLRMDAYLGDKKTRRLRVAQVEKDVLRRKVKSQWSSMRMIERVAYIADNAGFDVVKWGLPRMFGLAPFSFVKWLYLSAERRGA